jgi:hypothetical protein
MYDPRCCRFPKQCHCRRYDVATTPEHALAPPDTEDDVVRAASERLTAEYARGLFRGAEIALEDLLNATLERADASDDPDEMGPTWNGLAGHLRDVLARAQEQRPA